MIRRFIIIIIRLLLFFRVRHHLFFRVMGRRMGRSLSPKKNCAEVVLLHSARSVRPSCVWPVSFRHSGKKDEQHAMVSLSKM